MTLIAYLSGLSETSLAALLKRRPDVLAAPAPADLAELADRLGGFLAVDAEFVGLDRDGLLTAQAIALLGEPTADELADRLGPEVPGAVEALLAAGLAWRAGGHLGLVDTLAGIFVDGQEHRRFTALARHVRSDLLDQAVAAFGGTPSSMRKAEKVDLLAAAYADPGRITTAVATLSQGAHARLVDLVTGVAMPLFGRRHPADGPLVEAGLVLPSVDEPLVPHEVAVEVRLGLLTPVSGPPRIPAASGEQVSGRAAAEEAVRTATTLLDHLQHGPVAALKKGGVGTRERTRLERLGIANPGLWLDLGWTAGLLTETGGGYGVVRSYPTWRDGPPAQRWAGLARAWWRADFTPTDRGTGRDEIPPPVPITSRGGILRRALLRASAGGRSVTAAVGHLDHLCPLLLLDDEELADAVTATLAEAETLGVVADDRLTALGEALVAGDLDAPAAILGSAAGALVLQSDLSAILSGEPPAGAMRVLGAAAVVEGTGAATSWRFSAATVRAALDAGWTAVGLREALADASGRALPQPLDYLIGDVARVHGSVLVSGALTCLTGPEALLAEILHTRSVGSLRLRALAPTVLTTTAEPKAVLAALRKAGFAPMPADADGVVALSAASTGVAPENGAPPSPTERGLGQAAADSPPADPEVLAAALHARPVARRSETFQNLERLAPHLGPGEIGLLADALENRRDVVVAYRNAAGNDTVRGFLPQRVSLGHLTGFCLLRRAERMLRLDGVQAVSAPI